MRVCHLDKVDQIREHVRQLIAPNKLQSEEENRTKELDFKETQGAVIELEAVGGAIAKEAREHKSSSSEKPVPLQV